MSLVLAIERDAAQAEILRDVLRGRVGADLIVVTSRTAAIAAIKKQVPDLILITALLSPRDEEALVAHLRSMEHATHLQTVTIPQFRRTAAPTKKSRFFSKKQAAPAGGCDPAVFADEVATYLARAREVRREAELLRKTGPASDSSSMPAFVAGGTRERAAEEADPWNPFAQRREAPRRETAPADPVSPGELESTSLASEVDRIIQTLGVKPSDVPATDPLVSLTDPAPEEEETIDLSGAITLAGFEVDADTHRAADEEARRAADEELRRAQAEAEARLAAEEQARQRAAEEEALRRGAEEEALRLAAEEEARRQAVEEEARRLAAEEEARRQAEERRLAEEAAAVRAAEEAARRAAEEEARHAAELEQARRAAEAEARRIAEEEKRRAAEAEAARRAAEAEAARRAAEEEAARRAAEEEARRAAEAEAARLAAEAEAARRAAEAEAKRAAEEARRAAEEAKRAAEAEKRRRAEEEARRAAEEKARRAAEQARRAAEEEARRAAEAEAKRVAAEAEARRAAEAEARLTAELERVRQETEARRAAELAALQEESEALRQRAINEARAAAEAEAREALTAELARVRAEAQTEIARVQGEAEHTFEQELTHVRARAEQALADELARTRAEEEQERQAQLARALQDEVARVRADADARLEAELDRVRREAEHARRTDQAELDRVRREADERLAAEMARLRADAERRQAAELDEIRRQVSAMREAAAQQARAAAADALAAEVARGRSAPAPIPLVHIDATAFEPPPSIVDAQEPPADYYQLWREEHETAEVPPAPPPVKKPQWFHIAIDRRTAMRIAAGLLLVLGVAVSAETRWWSAVADGVWGTAGSLPGNTPDTPSEAPVEPPAPRDVGDLTITTTPAGVRVLLDGKPVGKTPLTLTDLKPRKYKLVLEGEEGTIRREVTVRANERVVADETFMAGWLAVHSRIPLDVLMTGRRIGSSSDGQLLMPPGRHSVTLQNAQYNFRETIVAEIEPGRVRAHNVKLPLGRLSVDAPEGAEVWIEGERVGEGPLRNVPVPIGTREVVVKHPSFGERREFVEVRHDRSLQVQPRAVTPDAGPPKLLPLSRPKVKTG